MRNNIFEKIITILFIPIYLLWQALVFMGKLIVDILNNVRGRFVKYVGAIAFVILMGYILKLFSK